ncbi:hypothetical protein [Paenibacillus polymyxa]|uniref:hypothetical protein n=1 Tax=Paenibacillus polymyxa TaxID=1406 RepID=UPI0004974679|nr:hypothetical protein [Paenibacillus polymyxa]
MINITEKCTNRDGYQMIYVNTNSQQGEMSNNEWEKDVSKHLSMYQSIKNKEEISFNDLSNLSEEGVSFWIKVVNTDCYNTSDVLIELTLSYVNKEVTYYISRETYNKIINKNEKKIKELIHMNKLIGCKVFGNWGMAGWDYGIVVNEFSDSIGTDITIEWKDGRKQTVDIIDTVEINDDTNIETVGYYIDIKEKYLSSQIV